MMKKSLIRKNSIKVSQYKRAINASYKVILCVWCFIFIILFANHTKATTIEPSLALSSNAMKQHKIIEFSGELSEEKKRALLKQAPQTRLDKTILREQHHTQKRQEIATKSQSNTPTSRSSIMIQQFSIFDAYSQLIDDFDGDGYFQTFSIAFDADVYTYNGPNQAHVYAEIYLSKHGGPWEYFHTTESFTIYGESTEDEYEVISNLTSGYGTNHYDVLIDLYEVGYSEIIATYSSDDNNSLYALPLESDEYDRDHIHEIHHAGNTSVLMIFLISIALLIKRLQKINKRND